MTPAEAKKTLELRLKLELALRGQSKNDGPEVVAEVAGGKVTRAEDGSLSFSSPGYATSDPERIKELMGGQSIAEGVGRDFDRDIIEAAPGGLASGVTAKAGQGIPFAGQWIDEATGSRGLRQLQGAMDRQYPKTAIAAEIGGGIAGSVPLAVPAVGAAMQAGTRAGRAVRGMGIAGTAAGVEGAVSGAGRANDGDRTRGAQVGGMIGAGVGGVVGALGPIVGEAATNLAKHIKKLDVRTIADELGISAPAARVVKAQIANDDISGAAAQIARIGDDAMLADAGPATAQALDTAMSGGGRALTVARGRVEARAAAANTRLTTRLNNILGEPEGVRGASKAISQRTAKARSAAYEKAFKTPLDYSTGGKGEKVLGVLNRIPERYLAPAIRRANERAQMAADGTRSIMASIDDAGNVTFSEMPNMRQLHELKVALDDVVRENTDTITGRMAPDAVDASKVAGMLRDALKEASPAYKAATKIGGDKIAEEQALDLGRRLLKRNTTFEDVREGLRGASMQAKAEAKRGMRIAIEETLSQVRRTITDPNIDAREAMQLVKELSSRANMKKARLVLGTDAKALFDELERAEAALALRAAVSRNSATAIRQAGQAQVRDEAAPGVLRSLLGRMGSPLDAAREVTETLSGIDPRSLNDREAQILAEIADALTGIRGKDAERAISAIQAAMQGQPIRDAEARLIGRLVAGTAMGGGYQAGSQALAPQ